jgi:hypothetical protein
VKVVGFKHRDGSSRFVFTEGGRRYEWVEGSVFLKEGGDLRPASGFFPRLVAVIGDNGFDHIFDRFGRDVRWENWEVRERVLTEIDAKISAHEQLLADAAATFGVPYVVES